ncbi:Slp family lipoprotein [Mangrovibacter yixingensis]|uniref:Slp family lipoprotein n=1 Tax=Mangrovibacter yixingensis TaxID=1529639 RepID=UPI001CFAA2B0|nr:Slp family lipoprotein [Mangrovibacter yixingensis]
MAGFSVRRGIYGLGLAACLLLTGCVSVPDAIKGTSPTPQMDLVRVMNAPSLYVGEEARFGGKVIGLQNLDGKTRLEIAVMPLDDGARPVLGQASIGRIYADVAGFLDPVDYRGHLITVVGPITGTEKGKIGQSQYTWMVMKADGFKRWRVVQQVVSPPDVVDPWMWGAGYHLRMRPAPWGYYNYGPARVESVVTE